MTTITCFINASPEAVFDVLRDGWGYPAWVVGASRVRSVETAWPAPGSVMHHSVGVWPVVLNDTTSVTAWAPPHHAALRARGWTLGEADVSVDVRPHEAGAIVRMGKDAVRGAGRFILHLLRALIIRARNRETLRRLRWLAEQRTQPPTNTSAHSIDGT